MATQAKEQQTETTESPVQAMGRAAMGEAQSGLDLGATLSARVTQKRQIVETAKATLQEAITLEEQARTLGNPKDGSGKVGETQGKAINILAQGVIAGLIDKPQVSAILGDAYGYRLKSDGTPGKTPDGAGGTLRKRIVTLSEAYAIAHGEVSEADKPRWAADKGAETLAPIVTQWLEGNLSPWQAYKEATEKPKRATVALHFDAAKLLKIVEALGNDDTLAAIRGNPALVEVYTAMNAAFTREIDPAIGF